MCAMHVLRSISLACCFAAAIGGCQQRKSTVTGSVAIPKAWNEEGLASLEVPLPDARFSPVAVAPDYYYRVPALTIYKSYPVYGPGREPSGYLELVRQAEPEIVFDPATLKTEEDWIHAGELVFDAPIFYDVVTTVAEVREPGWYQRVGAPLTKDGIMPFARYVIRDKGKIELGNNACAFCHTRVMPDGSIIKGAQGNFPFDRAVAYGIRKRSTVEEERAIQHVLFGAPWIKPDPMGRLDQMSLDDMASMLEAIPPGVLARHRSSPYYPPAVPDLIHAKDSRYLDKTGLVRHRGIEDMMRYAALNNEMDFLSRFGDFIPRGENFRELPDPATQLRYSDEQLYALARYIYSLKPPPNPNQFHSTAARGQTVFRREGCAGCHTPPLYTNNKLLPVEGFQVPEDHYGKLDIMPVPIGTDANLTLRTRRGTGYYKVPSLRGVWYRGPFEHGGSVATLEDWFDPKRLCDDYIPTGFKGYGVRTRAVKGHAYGLALSVDDRNALIAFLKTL